MGQVRVAEVIFGTVRRDSPFMLQVGAVDPPARLGAQVEAPGFRLGDEAVEPHYGVIDRGKAAEVSRCCRIPSVRCLASRMSVHSG